MRLEEDAIGPSCRGGRTSLGRRLMEEKTGTDNPYSSDDPPLPKESFLSLLISPTTTSLTSVGNFLLIGLRFFLQPTPFTVLYVSITQKLLPGSFTVTPTLFRHDGLPFLVPPTSTDGLKIRVEVVTVRHTIVCVLNPGQ